MPQILITVREDRRVRVEFDRPLHTASEQGPFRDMGRQFGG